MRKAALNATLAISILLMGCGDRNTRSKEATSSSTPGGESTSPPAQQASNQKMALVRFIQAVPANNMDLWFGDMKVFSNVNYKDVTPYVEVPAERHDFKLQIAGDNEPTAPATNNEGLTAGAHYTIIAERKGKNDALTIDTVTDDLTAPSAGKTKIRVINASLSIGKVDVYDPHGKVVSGVGEDSDTDYKEIPPVQGTLEIRRANNKVDVLRIPNMALQPDKLYTLVIVGGMGHPFEAIPVTDELRPAGPGTGD